MSLKYPYAIGTLNCLCKALEGGRTTLQAHMSGSGVQILYSDYASSLCPFSYSTHMSDMSTPKPRTKEIGNRRPVDSFSQRPTACRDEINTNSALYSCSAPIHGSFLDYYPYA